MQCFQDTAERTAKRFIWLLKLSSKSHIFDPALQTEGSCDEHMLRGWDFFFPPKSTAQMCSKNDKDRLIFVVKADHVLYPYRIFHDL